MNSSKSLCKTISILSLALLSSISVSAQVSGKVLYQGTWPLTSYRIVEGKGELVFNTTESSITPIGRYKNRVFNEGPKQLLEDNENPNFIVIHNVQHGDTSNMDNLTEREPFNIFVDLEKGELYQKVKNTIAEIGIPVDSIMLISEKTGINSWTLHPDQKLVGNYICQKATTRFRGRDYTAWFSPDIPLSFGPWKLNGLPGLILEVSDATHQVYFLAVSINIESGKKITINPETQRYPVVSVINYQKKIWDKNREIEKRSAELGQRLQAKAPREVAITFSTKVFLAGLELEYEFLTK